MCCILLYGCLFYPIISYESIAAEPAFQSALQAATGNETEIAKLHTKHLSDFGGYYLADVSLHVPAPVLVPAHVPENAYRHIPQATDD